MKKSGAYLAVYALEQIGVKKTFGIPGVHNTEIYDQLNMSNIEPILVTHEVSAAFMADAVSRTSDSIGTLVIVPAAGMTHAMSGIGEAYLDGIPMLIVSGGTRKDNGKSYQLHQIDMGKILDGIIKKYYLIENHKDIIPTIFDAYQIAMSDEPGPVFVEIPVEIQIFHDDIGRLPTFSGLKNPIFEDKKSVKVKKELSPIAKNIENRSPIELTVDYLLAAKNPGLYLGWGAVDAFEESREIAEILAAPVATTLQGLSAFSANHPLHTSLGFGPTATPAGQNAFKKCDCLLAVGLRFSELATGSYGLEVPENLIHIDINPEVFNKNYLAKISLTGDSKQVLQAIIKELDKRGKRKLADFSVIAQQIKSDKEKYQKSWLEKANENMVSPGFFFHALRNQLDEDAIIVTDDGNHTFLTAELFPVYKARHFISPTDFNCMGYCVPATIGAKLLNKNKQVIGIVGDGAFLMTGLELITAFTYKLGVIIFVFQDGELGQISQFQEISLNRKTASVLGALNIKGIAEAVNAGYLLLQNDIDTGGVISEALEISKTGKAVLVDVNIDYSRKTYLTTGVVKTNLSRFPFSEKVRMLVRAGKRHLLG